MSKIEVDEITNQSGDQDSGLDLSTNDVVAVKIAGSEKARVDASGRLLLGMTASSGTSAGFRVVPNDFMSYTTTATDAGDRPLILNRQSADGQHIEFKRGNSAMGAIGVVNTSSPFFTSASRGIRIEGNNIRPCSTNGANLDNEIDLGDSGQRFVDIFATNGTIQTSDQNEKQDTASLTTKELNVAKKLSTLFKTFRWKDKVVEKGDKARTHTGIIAQEVQSAFSAEGLDASKYGLFTSSTWWEKEVKVDAVKADEEKGIEAKDAYTYMDTKNEKTDGYTERTRLGVRYPELFSFIFSSIDARLTALEGK